MDLLAFLKQLPGKVILIISLMLIILVFLLLKLIFPKESAPVLPSPIPSLPPALIIPSASPAVQKPTGKGDNTYYQEIEAKLKKRYPLLPYLPYETSQFDIKYLGPLQLEVSLKTATASAKTDALNWIQSKGVDPASHEIIFK